MFAYPTDDTTRIRELADGRVVFFAAGRAYLQDDSQGQRLEAQLKWTQGVAMAAVCIALVAAGWVGNWWLGLLALPGVLLAVTAERFVVRGCQEITDPVARAEVAARAEAVESDQSRHLVWAVLAMVFVFVRTYLEGGAGTPMRLLEAAIVVLVVAAGVARLWRRRRLRRERQLIGELRSADDKPIVPRWWSSSA